MKHTCRVGLLVVPFVASCFSASQRNPLDGAQFSMPSTEHHARRLWKDVERNPAATTPRLTLAALLVGDQQLRIAVEVLEPVTTANAHDPLPYVALATILRHPPVKDLVRALFLLQQAERLDPRNDGVTLALANTYRELNQIPAAIAAYDRTLTLSSHPIVQLNAHLGLHACYRKLNKTEEARFHMQQARNIHPGIDTSDMSIYDQKPPPIAPGIEDDVHAPPDERIRRIERRRSELELEAR